MEVKRFRSSSEMMQFSIKTHVPFESGLLFVGSSISWKKSATVTCFEEGMHKIRHVGSDIKPCSYLAFAIETSSVISSQFNPSIYTYIHK